MASETLRECFEEQSVICLSCETGYANKQHMVFCKAFLSAPPSARYTGIGVSTRRNAVGNDLALRNAVEALHADSDLFPHSDWNDAMAKRVTMHDSGRRLDLTFRKIMNGVQQLCVSEKQHCRKRVA